MSKENDGFQNDTHHEKLKKVLYGNMTEKVEYYQKKIDYFFIGGAINSRLEFISLERQV
jgi:hypothetical protein